MFEWRESVAGDQHLDGSGGAGGAGEQPLPFEGEDHLVDGGRRDAEVALDVGLRGRAPVDSGVVVDEGEVLALLGGEGVGHVSSLLDGGRSK